MKLTELEVWLKAMDLVVDVYQSTKRFPKDEIYGLRQQIRRAAVSVVSNIAGEKVVEGAVIIRDLS